MRGNVSSLSVLTPTSLRSALVMLRDEGPLTPIAGATDLYVSLNFGTLGPTRFLNILGIDAMRRIEMRGDVLRIGALATYSAIARSRGVAKRLPILAEASREVGGVQIQNRGTIGGNVANASPAGDTLPVLSAAEAVVVLTSVEAERRVPFSEFYTGYRATVMQPDELIVALEIPPLDGQQWFRKVGTRAAQAISKVVLAGIRGTVPRIALGSVGPTVIRAHRTEQKIAGGATPDEAALTLEGEITPIDDVRSTAVYRRTVAGNMLRQFLAETA